MPSAWAARFLPLDVPAVAVEQLLQAAWLRRSWPLVRWRRALGLDAACRWLTLNWALRRASRRDVRRRCEVRARAYPARRRNIARDVFRQLAFDLRVGLGELVEKILAEFAMSSRRSRNEGKVSSMTLMR